MMRLIDADVFEVVALKDVSDEFVEGARFILEMIDDAPTIEAEPVKHGYWLVIGMRFAGAKLSHYCSICGGHGWDTMQRCPHCGAFMDGGNDEQS